MDLKRVPAGPKPPGKGPSLGGSPPAVLLRACQPSIESQLVRFRFAGKAMVVEAGYTYREATSGIIAEALALGKPVVVPEDTRMARGLQNSGAGVQFTRPVPTWEPRSWPWCINREYLEAAGKGNEAWRAFHSAATMADMLLEEAGLEPRVVNVSTEKSRSRTAVPARPRPWPASSNGAVRRRWS